jgi:hypothetical protein
MDACRQPVLVPPQPIHLARVLLPMKAVLNQPATLGLEVKITLRQLICLSSETNLCDEAMSAFIEALNYACNRQDCDAEVVFWSPALR